MFYWRPAGNYVIQGVREGQLVTLIPAEANRSLWREDINAGRKLFGHTSYISCIFLPLFFISEKYFSVIHPLIQHFSCHLLP